MEGNEKPKILIFFLLIYFCSFGDEKTVTKFDMFYMLTLLDINIQCIWTRKTQKWYLYPGISKSCKVFVEFFSGSVHIFQ